MYTQIVQCSIQKSRIPELRDALPNEVHPILRRQPGFVDVIETLDADSGQFVCLSIWKSKEDAERFGRGDFAQIAERLVPLADGEPSVSRMPLENSTAHQVKAGKAAA